MQFRCPTHDLVFDTITDHRHPGFVKKSAHSDEPDEVVFQDNCHPDCPQNKANVKTDQARRSSRQLPAANQGSSSGNSRIIA